MTATLDKTGDSWFHDFVLSNFGLTPFINTFPDFSAGGAVMITALFIAAGMEVRIIKYISYKFQLKSTSLLRRPISGCIEWNGRRKLLRVLLWRGKLLGEKKL